MQTKLEVRAPVYNLLGTIDCELNHPEFGWIKYTASPDDNVQMGREVHAALLAGAAGEIGPYNPANAARYVPETITRRQALLALLDAGRLDALEAQMASIADPVAKRKAQIEFDSPDWGRHNVWLIATCEQVGMSADDLDNLFINAASL